MKKVFLGGTVTKNNPLYGWRGKLIPMLNIKYFNPVVKHWNEEAIEKEYYQKNKVCDYELYVITPEMRGYFSIAEAASASKEKKDKVIFCVLNNTYENNKKFNDFQLKSLNDVGNSIKRNGGKYFKTLEEVTRYLNNN